MCDAECVGLYNASDFQYSYYKTWKNFTEANQHCQNQHNGSLAIIKDNSTLMNIANGLSKFISEINLTRYYFRIGLHAVRNGSCEWDDGSKFDGKAISTEKFDYCFDSEISFAINFNLNSNKNYVRCVNDSRELQYICQSSIKATQKANLTTSTAQLQQTSATVPTSITHQQTSFNSQTRHTSTKSSFTTQAQKFSTQPNSFTQTQGNLSTFPFVIIGGISAVFIVCALLISVCVLKKWKNKRKNETTEQTVNERLERNNEIYETELAPSINLLSLQHDTEYATIAEDYKKSENMLVHSDAVSKRNDKHHVTESENKKAAFSRNKTDNFRDNEESPTLDTVAIELGELSSLSDNALQATNKEFATAHYASVDVNKKQRQTFSKIPAFQNDDVARDETHTYALVNKQTNKQ